MGSKILVQKIGRHEKGKSVAIDEDVKLGSKNTMEKSNAEVSDEEDSRCMDSYESDQVNSSDADEYETDDEMKSLSGDDNAEGDEWMDAEDSESGSNSSSSDSENSSNGTKGAVGGGDHGDPKLHSNAGWADAMAKILRTSKPRGKKTIVLAKAKKLSQLSAPSKSEDVQENYGFEIDGEEKVVSDVKPKVEELDVKPDITYLKKAKRRDQLAEGKVKPSVLHRERERALSKIATKGVVQLFNAVREQQKDITCRLKEAHGSVRKEDKILKSIDKRAFLDVLMGNARSERVEENIRTKPEKDGMAEKKKKTLQLGVF